MPNEQPQSAAIMVDSLSLLNVFIESLKSHQNLRTSRSCSTMSSLGILFVFTLTKSRVEPYVACLHFSVWMFTANVVFLVPLPTESAGRWASGDNCGVSGGSHYGHFLFKRVQRLCHQMLQLWLRSIARQERTQQGARRKQPNTARRRWWEPSETDPGPDLRWSCWNCSLLPCSSWRFLSSRRSACKNVTVSGHAAALGRSAARCRRRRHLDPGCFRHTWLTSVSMIGGRKTAAMRTWQYLSFTLLPANIWHSTAESTRAAIISIVVTIVQYSIFWCRVITDINNYYMHITCSATYNCRIWKQAWLMITGAQVYDSVSNCRHSEFTLILK